MRQKRAQDILSILLFIVAVMTVTYITNGIYPFGGKTIARADMVLQNTPALYYIWDILHGHGSPFFTWMSGLGLNITGAISLGSLLSPLNIFLYLTPRAGIDKFINILVVLKMMAIAISMYAYLSSKNTDSKYKVIGSVLYAFAGSTLVHYQIMLVMDAAFFLPLVMLGINRIWNKKGNLLFIVMLTWSLMVNMYMGLITLLFVFLYCGCKLFLDKEDKELTGSRALSLGLGVISSALLSSIILFPVLFTINSSPRVNESPLLSYTKALYHMWNMEDMEYALRLLVCCALPVSIIIVSIARYKIETLNKFKWQLILLALLVYAAVMPATEVLWHGGSRANWPVRFVYVIAFAGIELLIEMLKAHPLASGVFKFKNLLILIATSIVTGALTGLIYHSYNTSADGTLILIIEIIFIASYIISLKLKRNETFIVYLLVIELTISSVICFTPNKEISGAYDPIRISEAEQIGESIDEVLNSQGITIEPFDRIKNDYAAGSLDYSLIAGYESISNAWHVIDARNQFDLTRMGYMVNWTQLTDVGGTVITDAILHETYYLNGTTTYNDELYSLLGTNSGASLYRFNYTMPVVMPLQDYEDIKLHYQSEDRFTFINNMWSTITNENQTIVNDLSEQFTNCEATIHIDEPSLLYFYKDATRETTVQIYVNGEAYEAYNFGHELTNDYPVGHSPAPGFYDDSRMSDIGCDGIVYLGSFENQDVTIRITGDIYDQELHLGSVNVNDFISGVNMVHSNAPVIKSLERGNQSLNLTISNVNSPYILLPIADEDGWTATVNGNGVRLANYNGLIAIPVNTNDDEVTIEMTFKVPDMRMGIYLSAFGLIITALCYLIRNKSNFIIKSLSIAAIGIYKVLLIVILLGIYIIPLIFPIFG